MRDNLFFKVYFSFIQFIQFMILFKSAKNLEILADADFFGINCV